MVEDEVTFLDLKKEIQSFWQENGLDEHYMRESRNLCLQADGVRRDSLISKALITRNNEKFLKFINLGLPLDYTSFENYSANILYRQKYLPSFLNQAIDRCDLNRVEMLLAAGAKPEIYPLYPFYDTISHCILSKNISFDIFAAVLSFIDEPIQNHWISNYLGQLQDYGVEWAGMFAELFRMKLEEQNIDYYKFEEENAYRYKLSLTSNLNISGIKEFSEDEIIKLKQDVKNQAKEREMC